MPYQISDTKSYDLCLLDTNIISELLNNYQYELKTFLEDFGPSNYAPCFTIYNIIELHRREDLYKKFLKFFSQYPCFLLKPYNVLFEEELKNYSDDFSVSPILKSFSPFKKNIDQFENFLNYVFSEKDIKQAVDNWRKEEHEILTNWLGNRGSFSPSKQVPNSTDAEKYIKQAGIQTVINHNPIDVGKLINNGVLIDIDRFPTIKIMLYSQYYRLFDSNWEPKPQEVSDVLIMGLAPYVDCVLTEKYQAEILKKVKNKVPWLEHVEIKNLKNLRQ